MVERAVVSVVYKGVDGRVEGLEHRCAAQPGDHVVRRVWGGSWTDYKTMAGRSPWVVLANLNFCPYCGKELE